MTTRSSSNEEAGKHPSQPLPNEASPDAPNDQPDTSGGISPEQSGTSGSATLRAWFSSSSNRRPNLSASLFTPSIKGTTASTQTSGQLPGQLPEQYRNPGPSGLTGLSHLFDTPGPPPPYAARNDPSLNIPLQTLNQQAMGQAIPENAPHPEGKTQVHPGDALQPEGKAPQVAPPGIKRLSLTYRKILLLLGISVVIAVGSIALFYCFSDWGRSRGGDDYDYGFGDAYDDD